MIEIKRRWEHSQTEIIYALKEGQKLGLEYTHWKDVQPGQWALTDDGYLTMCRRRIPLKRGCKIFLGCGVPFSTQKRFDFEPMHKCGVYSVARPITRGAKALREKGNRDALTALALQVVTGRFDFQAIALMLRSTERNGRIVLRRLFAFDETRTYFYAQTREIMADLGFDTQDLKDFLLRTIDTAEKAGRADHMLETVRHIEDLMGIGGDNDDMYLESNVLPEHKTALISGPAATGMDQEQPQYLTQHQNSKVRQREAELEALYEDYDVLDGDYDDDGDDYPDEAPSLST